MPPDVLVKRPGETRLYAFDFSHFPEIVGGETLASGLSVTANAVGLTLGTPSISSATVICTIAGGLDGEVYNLSCAATTSAGRILCCVGTLQVKSYGY